MRKCRAYWTQASGTRHLYLIFRGSEAHKRFYDTYAQQLQMLSPRDLRLTFPEYSKHLNEQHFYQAGIRNWSQRSPRPLTINQIVQYGRLMSKQKVLQSAIHVAEELTIRFAHRIRQMQNTPYRLMGHPALLDTYEQYVDSFEMLRRLGMIKTLEDNERLMEAGRKLLLKHTLVVTNVIRGVRDIINKGAYKPEDVATLNELTRSMMTSRLSRRVLVKQHAALFEAWRMQKCGSAHVDQLNVGEVKLTCCVKEALEAVEPKAKANLANIYGTSVSGMPEIILEGSIADVHEQFPYLWPHFEFAFGELIYNSLEACLKNNVRDPINVTVSVTPDFVMARISDHGGGIPAEDQATMWSFTEPRNEGCLTPQELSNHHFFSALFPKEELARLNTPLEEPDIHRNVHLGLGLPLSRLHLEYWGGALELHSIDGFGCDALLRVSRNGSKQENLRLSD